MVRSIAAVARAVEEIEHDITQLSIEERNSLLRRLIAKLDSPADGEAEKSWLAESQRRYQELVEGKVEGIPGPVVFERLRLRLER